MHRCQAALACKCEYGSGAVISREISKGISNKCLVTELSPQGDTEHVCEDMLTGNYFCTDVATTEVEVMIEGMIAKLNDGSVFVTDFFFFE